MSGKRYHQGRGFPYWIFFILFFVFMGKSGFWVWMFPVFLYWVFGPMLWSVGSGTRKWEDGWDWCGSDDPIPAQWQTPSQPAKSPKREPVAQQHAVSVNQPMRSTVGLPVACSACGGPVNSTTLDWRANAPHCGYCGTNLK